MDKFDKVRELIRKIEDVAADGGYDLYRGEPDCEYPNVSSSLYRQLAYSFGYDSFALDQFQEGIIERAVNHLSCGTNVDRREVIMDIQHKGGASFLIDFTEDVYVSIFFACNQLVNKSGRVVLAKKSEFPNECIFSPPSSHERGNSQSSVLIRPQGGLINPRQYRVIKIHKELKLLALLYLREGRKASMEMLFPGISGFVEDERIYVRAVEKKLAGDRAWSEGRTDESIRYYNEAIDIKPDYKEAYHEIGSIYLTRAHRSRFPDRELAKAEQNFSAVQSFNPYSTLIGSFNPDPVSGIVIKEAGGLGVIDSYDFLYLDGEIRDVIFKYGELDEKSEREWMLMRARDHNEVVEWLSKRGLEHKLTPNTTKNLKSGHVVVYYDSGALYLCLGYPRDESQFALAVEFLNTAICRIPDFIFAYVYRAKIRRLMGEDNEMEQDIAKAIKISKKEGGLISGDAIQSFVAEDFPVHPQWIYKTPREGSYSMTLYRPPDADDYPPWWLYAPSSEPIIEGASP